LALQVKLLRVLEDEKIRRLGETRDVQVDVRIIAATHRDLPTETKAGRFREDLFYRLNVLPILCPPLRDRREDIPLLAMHFLKRHSQRYGKQIGGFDSAGMQAMLDHIWPGNIRELDHAIERAVLLAQGDTVRAGDLALRAGTASSNAASRFEELTLEEAERLLIQKALTRFDGNVSQAAKALGLSRSALYRRLSSHGL
jgi:DNA-binding NtrC family response regulator